MGHFWDKKPIYKTIRNGCTTEELISKYDPKLKKVKWYIECSAKGWIKQEDMDIDEVKAFWANKESNK